MGIQVSDLTRDKPCYKKEFIDFEFDGKHISEFGMVAVFDGGRHSFDASSDFEDEVSDIVGAPGQLYWGTKIKPLVKTFSLVTDGMTEQQVNAFKRHFRPGKYGKFIELTTRRSLVYILYLFRFYIYSVFLLIKRFNLRFTNLCH